jgi:hypothetical protein
MGVMLEQAGKDTDYYLLSPKSFQVRIGIRQRRIMYRQFVEFLGVDAETTILDVGVADIRSYGEAVNYLESWHTYPHRITAIGLGDASFLRDNHPGVTVVRGSGLALPFRDKSFDVVHSSAVIEHVGSLHNQKQLVLECARVARRGFLITTPYRWFPVEVHTSLPLLHWLPKHLHRAVLSHLGYAYYCRENNLNLMDKNDFRRIGTGLINFETAIYTVRLLGLPSNLIFVGRRSG